MILFSGRSIPAYAAEHGDTWRLWRDALREAYIYPWCS